jgi:hypothetical protein
MQGVVTMRTLIAVLTALSFLAPGAALAGDAAEKPVKEEKAKKKSSKDKKKEESKKSSSQKGGKEASDDKK